MTGREHAERVLSARTEDSEQRRWQIRKGEILHSGIPVFWSHLCQYLKNSADEFNSTAGLIGDSGLQVYPCDTYVTLNKTSSPVSLCRVALLRGTERVRVTIEVLFRHTQAKNAVNEYLFDVRLDGTIELDRKDYCTFAKELFGNAVALFR